MKKRIAVLGSTGSVGTQALDVLRNFKEQFELVGLTAHSSVSQLKKQAEEFSPELVGISGIKPDELPDQNWLTGPGVLQEIARMDLDMLLVSVVGLAGLRPCLAALRQGTDVALANKEVLVIAGELMQQTAREYGAKIIPVDSEHSAIFQALQGEKMDRVSRIIITASGGPFLNCSPEQLQQVKLTEVLDHPNWEMGPKITVDSATMMNKGLEVIEACRLFDLPPDRVGAFIHPQSTVHGLVEFSDNSILAQCSTPDMRLPVQYALFYPERGEALIEPVDFSQPFSWDFQPIDIQQFPAYGLAREALLAGGTYPAVLNAANEVAVEAFISNKIEFFQITEIVEHCLQTHAGQAGENLEELLQIDRWAREQAEQFNC